MLCVDVPVKKDAKTTRINRCVYVRVVQQYLSNRWKDVSIYETDSQYNFLDEDSKDQFNLDLKLYQIVGHPIRVIKRRYRTVKL